MPPLNNRRLLYTGGFRQSMSRKDNCYDKLNSRRNYSKTASLNRLKMPAQKSSVASNAITTELDFTQVWVIKVRWSLKMNLKLNK